MAKSPSKSTSSKKSSSAQMPLSARTAKPRAKAKKSADDSVMPAPPPELTKVDREKMVQVAAYHIAERDGFQAGQEEKYWLQAEQQIAALLNSNVHQA